MLVVPTFAGIRQCRRHVYYRMGVIRSQFWFDDRGRHASGSEQYQCDVEQSSTIGSSDDRTDRGNARVARLDRRRPRNG